MNPPYKTSNGNWLTVSLFHEPAITNARYERVVDPIFSFTGKEGLIDARKTFIELEDPTGYKWAIKYLNSWEHFQVLLKAKWFTVEYESWLEELQIALKSKAIQKIKEIASGNSVQALAAAKYVAASEWDRKGRGRPSKNELTGELKKQAAIAASDADDAERIGLKVIKGGRE